MTVSFIKLEENAIVPTYGTPFSAGADIYALPNGDIEIKSGETKLIHTGIAMQIPEGYGGFIFARSGIATKRGLAPSNKVGVIDSDYRGEIMVPAPRVRRRTSSRTSGPPIPEAPGCSSWTASPSTRGRRKAGGRTSG